MLVGVALACTANQLAANVLADRLDRLEGAGVITKQRDPENARRRIYSPD